MTQKELKPMKAQKEECPKCKERDGVELIYDAPTEEDAEKVRKGLAIPGGFMPKPGTVYKWRCQSCGHLWGEF